MSRPVSEGVIKFDCQWLRTELPAGINLRKINYWRNRLHRMKLIGLYPDGYGYGNLSTRIGRSKKFVITGSQTEGIKRLQRRHYTAVTDYSFGKNRVRCRGLVRSSSESLTHAMVYEKSPSVGAVMHIHHHRMWKNLRGKVPTTPVHAAYGTPEMAEAVERLYRRSGLAQEHLFVMAGHEDGIIVFGSDLRNAFDALRNHFKFEIR